MTNKRWWIPALFATALVALAACSSPPTKAPENANASQAAHTCSAPQTGRELSVCNAYRLAASTDRVEFYNWSTSANPDRVRAAKTALETRYAGNALKSIEAQTAAWPADQVVADLPQINISTISLSPDTRTAVLQDLETWRVHTQAGVSLFAETNQAHTIHLSLMESKGAVFERTRWVVTDIA
jgi:hypothetical protein